MYNNNNIIIIITQIADNVIYGCRRHNAHKYWIKYGVNIPSKCHQAKVLQELNSKYGVKLPGCQLHSSLQELLDFYKINPSGHVQVMGDFHGRPDEMVDFQGRPLQDPIAKLRDVARFSSKLIPHLYQKMLRWVKLGSVAFLITF